MKNILQNQVEENGLTRGFNLCLNYLNKMKKEHPSNSYVQIEIEKSVVTRLEEKYKCNFQKKTENLKFEFDFYNEDERIIGEVYSGIDKLSPASKKKVIADCFKLITAEQMLGGKWKKQIVFVDESIKKKFEGKSWIAEAIKLFEIELKVIEISEQDKNKLQKVKEKQQIGNKLKDTF